MSLLDQLSSATGDKQSNLEIVKKCITTPALLHTVAEGLRTGNPKVKIDCIQILNEVGKYNDDLLSAFVADFLDATRAKSKRVARLAYEGLSLVVSANPTEVYAERERLLEVARGGGSLAVAAMGPLAALCGNNPNYRGKLLGHLLRLLPSVADKDLLRWVKILAPAVEGSTDGVKRLVSALEPRRDELDKALATKLDRLLVKIERTTVKKKKK